VELPDLTKKKHIHFIGIGGVGMGPIADILCHQGHKISGSDPSENAMVERLRGFGVKIFHEHKAENIVGAELIVTSTAIPANNPEVLAAKAANIPVIPRAQMLAALMTDKDGIAIAGTHGKTTTTSLLACILTEGNLDPTYVIGGLLQSAGANSNIGKSRLFIAEADESDASFLFLHPKIAIVTNIDADHMETYNGDFDQLCATFIRFLHQLPKDGLAVLCIDDPVVRQLIPQIERPILTYGFSKDADVQIHDFRPVGFHSQFKLTHSKDRHQISITLNSPGEHNVLNAAAACAIAFTLGVTDAAIQDALRKFAGVGRRMQVYGELETRHGKALLVDDYGHHPREIAATWKAAHQAWPSQRLVVAYQPHRYTRTRDLFDDFVMVLSDPDVQLILLDVYPAGELPIKGFDGPALFKALKPKCKNPPVFVSDISKLPATLKELLQEGDILLMQGAGSIGRVAPQLKAQGLLV
jgi:UDP-N-acetylmuramate--alanine ligase